MSDSLIIIPTYNEIENIEHIVIEVFKYAPKAYVLIIDDNSNDGTATALNNMASKNERISVIHRKGKRGRGFSGIDAFKEALKRNSIDYIIEMDADFSHDPRYIPLFLKEIKDFDIIIGSRYVRGGKDIERGFMRIFLSKIVNFFIRNYLGLNIKDCSSGYRCFRKKVIESLDLNDMICAEPSILEEVLYNCKVKKWIIKEIPIVFRKRKSGKTKLATFKLIKVFFDIFKIKAHIDSRSCKINPGMPELRRFGFTLALGLNIVGFIMFLRYKPHFIWLTFMGSSAILLAIVFPVILKPLKRVLDCLINSLGHLISFITLFIVFYGIFTPIGLLFRLLKKDILELRINKAAQSYWTIRERKDLSNGYYERMG